MQTDRQILIFATRTHVETLLTVSDWEDPTLPEARVRHRWRRVSTRWLLLTRCGAIDDADGWYKARCAPSPGPLTEAWPPGGCGGGSGRAREGAARSVGVHELGGLRPGAAAVGSARA